ncbi:uncharacterized protein LOC125804685 [Astyanax mexicanus]|uniref:uncharacterized protein LOC125804685 n=1 Tax=Astyanax mexicanus TaxID=7994 RepID=UPI0020CAA5F0|nr:uncharacterized protein LOC125804685 [Astyanax mexicanus]
MAERAREFVASFLSDQRLIDTLTTACSSTSNPQPSFRDAESEVRSLFNRGPQTRVPDPTSRDFNLSVSGMHPPLPQSSVPTYNLRRLPRVNARRQTRPAKGLPQLETFTKEVVLLPDNTTNLVPRRASKAWLFENGHVKSAVEFNVEWCESEVMSTIRKAFMPQVEGCSLQLLLGCHNKLVKPSLAPHQEMTGRMLKKVFHQRSVHVQPDKVLLDQSSSESEEESLGCEPGISDASSKNETVVQQHLPHVMDQPEGSSLTSDTPEGDNDVILIASSPSETVRTTTFYSEYVNLLEIEDYEPEDAGLQEAIESSLSETNFRTLN